MSRGNADAQAAYYALYADLKSALQSTNPLLEIAGWQEVSSTIDSVGHLFRVRISNVEKMPMFMPAAGSGYQIIARGSMWATSSTSSLIRDATSGVTISAPSKIDGTLIVSYRFSLLRWLRAWIVWLVLFVVRVSIASMAIAVIGVVLWYIPWSKIITITITLIKATTSMVQTVQKESVTPTQSPSTENIIRPIRI